MEKKTKIICSPTIFAMVVFVVSIIFLTNSAEPAQAATYYFDGSDTGSQNLGTYAEPFNAMTTVNNYSFATGDDLYFKVNRTTTIAANGQLKIDWSGSAEDQVIVGAYYGDGQFGLNGNARPIIDGDNFVAPDPTPDLEDGGSGALIECMNQTGYVTIRDLQVQNSNGGGIEVSYIYTIDHPHTDHNTIENCYTKNTKGQGILLARASHCTITGNTVERASYNRDPGASIEVTGMGNEIVTQYNEVTGNTVYWGFEGIGAYKGAIHTTIDGNTVYDCRSFHIYGANSQYTTVTNNVVYETPEQLSGDGLDYLIAFDCESHAGVLPNVTGNNTVSENFVAGGNYGIVLLGNGNDGDLDPPVYQSNNIISNNIIADCNFNIAFTKNVFGWTGNVVEHNVSYTSVITYTHSNNYSPYGVTWEPNIFDDTVNGNAGLEDCTVALPLEKTSGWDDLTAGAVSASTFALSDAGSAGRTTCFGEDTISPSTPTGLAVE